MLSVIMLSVIMLSVIMLSAIMLRFFSSHTRKYKLKRLNLFLETNTPRLDPIEQF